VKGANYKAAYRFWRETLFPSNSTIHVYNPEDPSALPITASFIPLMHICDFDVLKAFIDTSESLDNVDIFESHIGAFVCRFIWKEYGRTVHVKTTLQFLLYLILWTISTFTFEALIQNHVGEFAWFLQVATFFSLFNLIYQEYLQLKSEAEGSQITWPLVYEHFTADLWNGVDISIFFCSTIGIFIRFGVGNESDSSRIVIALASVLSWFKVLYFMRVSLNIS
jgi:hypothetical protein